MGHLLGVVQLVGNILAVDYSYFRVLRMGFVDEGYGCFIVLGCHCDVLLCIEYGKESFWGMRVR